MATTLTNKHIVPGHAYGPFAAYEGLTDAQKNQFIHFNMDESGENVGTISFKGKLFGKAKYPTAITNVGDGSFKLTMSGMSDLISGSLKASNSAYGLVKTTSSISGANNDASVVPTYSIVYSLETNKAPKDSPTFTGTPKAPTPTNDANTTQIATVEYVLNKMAANDAMCYKGTLGTGGNVSSLPTITTSTVKNGDTYKVISEGTYNNQTCKVGDMFIANKQSATTGIWDYIPSANENETSLKYSTSPTSVTLTDVAKYGEIILGSAAIKIALEKGSTGVTSSDEYVPTLAYLDDRLNSLRNEDILTKVGSISSNSLTITPGTLGQSGTPYTIELKSVNTAAGQVGISSNATPAFGGTVTIYNGSTDIYGRVTNNESKTIKIPDAVATSTAKGLMSASDKANLDTLVAGCCWYETSVS